MKNNHSLKFFLLLLFCVFAGFCPHETIAASQYTSAPALSQPDLRIASSVTDVNGGTLVANDVIEYTFTVTNIGDDSATLIVFTDSIPASTTYVSGSLKIDSVTKTDGNLDDQAEYSSLSSKVTFRLGTLAGSLTGGSLLPNASTVVKFRVKVNSSTSTGTSIVNQGSATYSGILVVDSRTSYSDSDLTAPGSQSSTIFVNNSPPSIQLTHTVLPNGTQSPGTDLTYTSTFTNTGGSQAQNFAVTEPIPVNTYFKINSAAANLSSTGLTLVIQYSNDNGSTFAYTPTSGGGGGQSGYDRNVTHIRFVFTGLLSRTAPNNTGTVSFTAQIR